MNLSAHKDTIFKKESAVLSWTSENAETLSIDCIGAVDTDGSITVTPSQTTTHALTVQGDSGTVTA